MISLNPLFAARFIEGVQALMLDAGNHLLTTARCAPRNNTAFSLIVLVLEA